MVRQQTPFRFTEREMDIAKGTDLPDLLTHLGYQVRRVGSYYTTREMDSLRIKERRTWRRYSNQTGGDAIAFLQEFCGKDFREAVNYLLEFNGHRARASPVPHQPSPAKKERPAFALPSAAPDQRHVFAYLRKRGIAPQVIQSFIQAGLLYEDADHHNCVFVGRDGGGQPVFASKRGTYDRNGPGFKGDVTGSNKDIAFRLPCDPGLDHVAVFEAPIDLMSFCTLHRQMRSNAVALCGLYRGAAGQLPAGKSPPEADRPVPGRGWAWTGGSGEVPGRVHPGGLCRVHSNTRPGQGLERVPASAGQRGEEAGKTAKDDP